MKALKTRTALLVGAAALAVTGCTGDNGEPPSTTTPNGDTEAAAPSGDAATELSAPVANGIDPPVGAATAAAGVTVTGSGVASGAPDVVRVTVGVEVQREEVQAALDDANATTEELITTLTELGIAEEDLQTRDFGIHPVMDHPERSEGGPTITGYQVRNLLEMTVRDVDRIGEIIQQAAETAGDHARVHGITFDLEEDQQLIASAREAAMADARDQAEHYAELAGRELGTLIGIQDQSSSSPRRGGMMETEAADSAVPIEPGQQDVTVHVVARWSLN